jgi:hypothetical protein
MTCRIYHMQEQRRDNIFQIAGGVATSLSGLAMFTETYAVREALKLSTVIPGLEGVNWGYYAQICAQWGKPVVDGLISVGADLGGAMTLIGFCEALRGIDHETARVVGPIIEYSIAGIFGLFGVLQEIVEIVEKVPVDRCANVGCGSYIDLIIFSALLAYPFLRNRRNNN